MIDSSKDGRFDKTYFDNYDGLGRSYDEYMKIGVTDPSVLNRHLGAMGRGDPKTMLDLGAADGSALLYFKSLILLLILSLFSNFNLNTLKIF